MKSFRNFVAEDYNHTVNTKAGVVGHIFNFKKKDKNFDVQVYHGPNSDIGYVYIPDEDGKTSSKGANRFGWPEMRKAHSIVKSVTGLKILKGKRDTGAGAGRIQKL